MNERDEQLKSLRWQLADTVRRLDAMEKESAQAGYIAEGVPRGRPLPPIENPYGPAAEMWSQWLPRRMYEGAGGGEGEGGEGIDHIADEKYLHEDASNPPHVFHHMIIEAQPAPDRGNDIVRSGTGHHLVHIPGSHMVNPGGHVDVSKAGASVKHAGPDPDGDLTELQCGEGEPDVTDVDKDPATATVDGDKGVAINTLTRIALGTDEYGVTALWAFFRKVEADYDGHVVEILGEERKELYRPPWGDADGQMLIWNNTSKQWETIVPPTGTADGDILVWDQTTDKVWKAVAPVEVTVVTDYQINGLKFQKKTRTLKVVAAGDESDWIDVHTGTECPEE